MSEAMVGHQEREDGSERQGAEGGTHTEKQLIIDIAQFGPETVQDLALRAVNNAALQNAIARRLREHDSGKEITVSHDSSMFE